MARIEGEVVIDRPIGKVFDFVADERNEPLYNPRLLRAVQISPGPIGLGTIFRAETTSMRRVVEMVIEITDYQRPHMLSSHTHLPTMDIKGTLRFESISEGTRMRWLWHLEPRGVLKLMTPLFVRIGRRRERHTWASLKRFLESPQGDVSLTRI